MAIRTHHSNQIYALIDQRELDIGFSLQERVIRNVKVNLLYTEQMVLIKKKSNEKKAEIIANNELQPEKQLYFDWGINFQMWHEKHWGPTTNTHIQIDTAKMLQGFLSNDELWAIVPVSIARNFFENGWVDVFLLEDPPPSRTCYHIERDGLNQHSQQISEFILQSKSRIEEIVKPWGN